MQRTNIRNSMKCSRFIQIPQVLYIQWPKANRKRPSHWSRLKTIRKPILCYQGQSTTRPVSPQTNRLQYTEIRNWCSHLEKVKRVKWAFSVSSQAKGHHREGKLLNLQAWQGRVRVHLGQRRNLLHLPSRLSHVTVQLQGRAKEHRRRNQEGQFPDLSNPTSLEIYWVIRL